MPTKVVRCRRKRSRARHAWVFSNEVLRTEGEPGPGDLVQVFDGKQFVGSGIYNPHSLIRVRVYSTENEELDAGLLGRRIDTALALRRQLLPGEEDFRLLYGESDRVPGLVVDKYADHFVVQCYAMGIDMRIDAVVEALRSRFDVGCIFEKDDFRLREPEGLERRERLLFGEPKKRVVISEGGARFNVDITSGQKTGYYFDHRVTRRKVRAMSAGRQVLDVFSYTGSFAINAALGGADKVLAIDASAAAATVATENSVLNGVAERCEFDTDNAFTALAELGRQGRRFDLVNLDPPAFIKAQRDRDAGMRGYRQVNALAMRLLSDDGVLVSSSCSHYLFWQDMLDMLVAASQDADRTLTMLDRSTQGPDHPVLLSMPESEYLRCFILRVS